MLTNKYNLPQPFVTAVEAGQKSYQSSHGQRSDISVTQLISPAQIVQLQRENPRADEDVSDRVWALLGQLMHGILESSDDGNELVEQRLYRDIAGWTISGQFDRFEVIPGILSDWKLCSVWEHIGGLRPEREQQLNCLAWLLSPIHKVSQLQIVSVYRDWSKNKALAGGDYPQQQVAVHNMRLWSPEEQERYISERVAMHQTMREGGPVTIPCTPEDQWAKPTVFAVMKQGRKSAVKLHKDIIKANEHATSDDKLSVVVRPGERTRCIHYCAVSSYCKQYAEEHADG